MQIVVNGTKITQDKKNIGFKKDNLVETIYVTVDTPSSYSYKLDVQYPKEACSEEQLYNIIDLPRVGNICTVQLTMDMLPFNGKYICQIRGINGDVVYHTDSFECWVKYSVDPTEAYDPVPSEFLQVESRITEYNNHPPYPDSTSGHWMIWNVYTHQYEESTIPIGAQLPGITPATSGKYLTNNGSYALWDDVDADKTFVFTQVVASSQWNIQHNLNKYPSITVVDSADNVVVGEIKYNNNNTATVTFTSAFGGKAYLN